MNTRSALGLMTVLAASSLLAGCQNGYDVPYNQRIVVQLKESTNENPVSATVKVDGKEVYGPGELAPGEPKNIPIHDSENGPKLTPGKHRISWTLQKKGMPGKVGSVDLTVFSGASPIKTQFSSTRGIMPPFTVSWWIDINVLPPAGAGTGQPPAKRP